MKKLVGAPLPDHPEIKKPPPFPPYCKIVETQPVMPSDYMLLKGEILRVWFFENKYLGKGVGEGAGIKEE